MKRILLIILFILVLGMALFWLQKELIPFNEQDTNQTATFYMQEDNSIDILTVGSSSVMVGFSPLILYENTGVTSYVRCSSVQAPLLTYYNVEETFKTQNPKLVVVSAYTLLLDYDYDKYESWVRRGVDYKKLSINKISEAREIADRSQWQTAISYVFPILRYHSRWDTEIRKAIKGEHDENEGAYDYMHGQYPVYRTNPIEDVSSQKMADLAKQTSSEDNLYWYQKMTDLCHSNGAQVLFLVTPDMRWTGGKHEEIKRVAEKMGADFLDFNVDGITAKAGLNWSRDFYDNHHVNAGGSVKLTNYLSNYISKEYNFGKSDVSCTVKKQFRKDIKQFKEDLACQ